MERNRHEKKSDTASILTLTGLLDRSLKFSSAISYFHGSFPRFFRWGDCRMVGMRILLKTATGSDPNQLPEMHKLTGPLVS
jgi:hypothetical protein